MERDVIEGAFRALTEHLKANDWDAWVDRFAEDCTFMNSALGGPVRGREGLRALTTQWPNIDNQTEWMVIEGNRLAVGWNERQELMPEGARYRGFSTFLFDDQGLVREYEGMFDMAAVVEAMG